MSNEKSVFFSCDCDTSQFMQYSSDCLSKLVVWIRGTIPLPNFQFEFAAIINFMEFCYNSDFNFLL